MARVVNGGSQRDERMPPVASRSNNRQVREDSPPLAIRAASNFASWTVICSIALTLVLRANAGVLMIVFEMVGFGYSVIIICLFP